MSLYYRRRSSQVILERFILDGSSRFLYEQVRLCSSKKPLELHIVLVNKPIICGFFFVEILTGQFKDNWREQDQGD